MLVVTVMVGVTTACNAAEPRREAVAPCEQIQTIAHRGFQGVHENTIEGFARAASFRADMIETDVWPTADGRLVIIHDGLWDRTTMTRGKVTETKLSAVRKIRTMGGATIPTFDEAVAESVRTQTPMLVEIKATLDWRLVGTVIRRHGADDLITMYGGSPEPIRELREAVPWVSTGLRPGASMSATQVASYGDFAMLEPDRVGNRYVTDLHAVGVSVFVRGPEESQWPRLVDAGADGFLLEDTLAFDQWCASQ